MERGADCGPDAVVCAAANSPLREMTIVCVTDSPIEALSGDGEIRGACGDLLQIQDQ